MYKNRRNVIKEIVKGFLETIACCVILGAIMLVILHLGTSQDDYYYTSDGNGSYIELVDRPCVVTEINGDYITVETVNDGELYTFYGTGYKIGTEIICTFTMTDELIKTK